MVADSRIKEVEGAIRRAFIQICCILLLKEQRVILCGSKRNLHWLLKMYHKVYKNVNKPHIIISYLFMKLSLLAGNSQSIF